MDLKTAIQISDKGDVIGWDQKKACYRIYRAEDGAPKGVSPEFLVMKKGLFPWPLTATAVDAFNSLLKAEKENSNA